MNNTRNFKFNRRKYKGNTEVIVERLEMFGKSFKTPRETFFRDQKAKYGQLGKREKFKFEFDHSFPARYLAGLLAPTGVYPATGINCDKF